MIRKYRVLIGIIAAFIIVAVAVPYFIPTSALRKPVMQWFESATGQKINLNGTLRIKLFPAVGVYVEDVTVHGADFTKDQPPLLALKSMNVSVQVLPLLAKNIVVKSLILEDPKIALRVNASNRGNWQQPTAPAATATPAKTTPNGTFIPPFLQNLQLHEVHLINGSVIYQNQATKENWAVKKLVIDLSLDKLDAPFDIKGHFTYNEKLIKFDGNVKTLQSFLADKKADFKGAIKADLFSIETDGKWADEKYSGKLNLLSPSLKNLMAEISRSEPQPNMPVLGLELNSNVDCSAKFCNFTNAAISLDDLQGKGDVKVRYDGKVPAVDLNLATQQLDITPFIPASASTSGGAITAAHKAATGKGPPVKDDMDLTFLRTFDLNANITTQGIKVYNIKVGKSVFKAKLQGGKLAIDIPDAEFYNGKVTTSVNIDSTVAPPSLEKHVVIKGIQMEPLLKDADVTDRFSGAGDGTLNVSGRGKNSDAIVASLQGNGQIKVSDGSIKGVDIASMVRNVQSAFKSVDTSSQKTDFSELGGTFTINQGIVTNNDLAMKAPLFRTGGAGTVDLPKKMVHYRLTPQIVSTIQGQGGKEKQGLGVPIIIEGPFDHLTYRPDLGAVVQDAIQNPEKLKETVGSVKEQLKENKDLLKGKNLKGLFKGLKP